MLRKCRITPINKEEQGAEGTTLFVLILRKEKALESQRFSRALAETTGLEYNKVLPPSSRRQATVHRTGTGFVKDNFPHPFRRGDH